MKLEDLPFDIPDNWMWIRHNAIFEIFGGSQPAKSKFIFAPKRDYIRLYQIRDYGLHPEPVYIPVKDAHKTTEKGDILLARYGASVGKVFFAEKGAYNVALAKVEKLFISELINKYYLFLFYNSSLYQTLVHNNSRSAQAGFNKEDLNDLFIPLPPLAEQQRIVDRIAFIEPLLAKYDSIEKKLSGLEAEFPEKLKKSILQYAIEGKLVKQDPNDEPASVLLERIKAEKERLIKEGKIKRDKNESYIYQGDDKNYYENLPQGWAITNIGSLGALCRGNGIKRNEIIADGYPCVRYGEMYTTYKDFFFVAKSHVSKFVFEKSQKAKKGDVLLSLTGENKDDISKGLAYLGEADIAIGGDMTVFRNFGINEMFLVSFLNSPIGNSIRHSLATGDIIVHMSNDKIASIKIMIPPREEQNRIVGKIKKILDFLQNRM